MEAFGSFVMDIFCAGSDIDLSVNFSNIAVEVSRQKRIETLKKFAKKFRTLQSNYWDLFLFHLFYIVIICLNAVSHACLYKQVI